MRRTPSSARASIEKPSSPQKSPRLLHRAAPARVAPNSASPSKKADDFGGSSSSSRSANLAAGASMASSNDSFAAIKKQLSDQAAALHGNQQFKPPEPPKAPDDRMTAWEAGPASEPSSAPVSAKAALSAKLGLAAGIGKGIKSLADIAKPAMKSPRFGKQLLTKSPLDIALQDALRAREDSKRAMSESEINLNKMYARDHDGMVTARALLVGSNRALIKLMGITEELEKQATLARERLVSDRMALRDASSASIAELTAHREMLARSLLLEIKHVETDSNFSLQFLQSKLHRTEGDMAALEDRLSAENERLTIELHDARQMHAAYAAKAERTEHRLSSEIARLCGVIEQMKADGEKAASDAAQMHAQVVSTMSSQLADKQRTIDAQIQDINKLSAQLAGTTASLNGQLSDLAKEKAEQERKLMEEKAATLDAARRKQMELDQQLVSLQAAKEQQERALSEELQRTQAEGAKQAESLKTKIEKMRKLQELALGGVAGEAGVAKAGKSPSTRGRQLLYFESLKSKTRETSSMSFRGQDVFAHEQLGMTKGSPK